MIEHSSTNAFANEFRLYEHMFQPKTFIDLDAEHFDIVFEFDNRIVSDSLTTDRTTLLCYQLQAVRSGAIFSSSPEMSSGRWGSIP